MTVRQSEDPRAPRGAPELDELQRGQEPPPTVEIMESPPAPYGEQRREVMVPDPGERPGAVVVGPPASNSQPPGCNTGRPRGSQGEVPAEDQDGRG